MNQRPEQTCLLYYSIGFDNQEEPTYFYLLALNQRNSKASHPPYPTIKCNNKKDEKREARIRELDRKRKIKKIERGGSY